jgi:hypothetical protein
MKLDIRSSTWRLSGFAGPMLGDFNGARPRGTTVLHYSDIVWSSSADELRTPHARSSGEPASLASSRLSLGRESCDWVVGVCRAWPDFGFG